MAVGRNLQSVVNRVSLRLQRGDGTVSRIGAVGVRIAAARDVELDSGGARGRHSIYRAVFAIGRRHGLPSLVWILRRTNRIQLIDIALQREVRAFAAYVGHGHHRSGGAAWR